MARINLNLTFSEANAILVNSKNKSMTQAIFDGKFDEFKDYISKLPGSIIVDLSEDSPICRIVTYDKDNDSCRVEKDYDIRWLSREHMISFVYYLINKKCIVLDDVQYKIIWNDDIVKHVCDSDNSHSYKRQSICFPFLVPKTTTSYKTDVIFKKNESFIVITTNEKADVVKRAQTTLNNYTKKGEDLFQEIAKQLTTLSKEETEDKEVFQTTLSEEERSGEIENKRIDDSLFDDIIKEQPLQ